MKMSLFARLALTLALGLVSGLMTVRTPAHAVMPRDPSPSPLRIPTEAERAAARLAHKTRSRPAPADAARVRARRERQGAAERLLRGRPLVPGPGRGMDFLSGAPAGAPADFATIAADAQSFALTGTDRVLVILVEFDPEHADTFPWSHVSSTWDPFGKCNASEYTGNPMHVGTAIAAQRLGIMYNVTSPTTFTYSGPLHNQIERPRSAADTSGNMIWTPDFSPQWYRDLIFGNGVRFQYTRQDGSVVNEDYTGRSVRDYYEDISGGRYTITGDVVGWVKVPHSVWWYGADPAPGGRSGVTTAHDGGIPGAGNSASFVRDALDAVNAAYPGFNWKQYDQDGDGVIDRLWIIHAGLGEEDNPGLLNRTNYGEGGFWSHSSSIAPYTVYSDDDTTVKAGPYIMMPENCGISVLAHEYAHNLGADDLYSYTGGETSAGFWTIMADSWTGYPNGFMPVSMDPWHLDNWGWLDPALISDPTRVHKVTLGQASRFPGGEPVRAAKILLPDGASPLAVQPENGRQWWGGTGSLMNGKMTLKSPIAIPAGGATLSFRTTWDIETAWDFGWVQASPDGGATWQTLANPHTSTVHDPSWIGSQYGLPFDLAAAGIGGFSGRSAAFPAWQTETFSLDAFAGKSVLLRFWYMTDWGYEGSGWFVDDVRVEAGGITLLADGAADNSGKWTLSPPWETNAGAQVFSHNFYLQWRNVTSSGGYDSAASDPRWHFNHNNSGMIAWYNNNFYGDNEVANHLFDAPSFGPKGRMLVAESHPEPYRDPYWLDAGYANEAANLFSRGQMRDAPFGLVPTAEFTSPFAVGGSTVFPSRPAVSTFSDGTGWYPGAEKVRRGPGYPVDDLAWISRQWDSSVVMPSTVPYGPNAPGYTPSETMYYAVGRGTNGTLVGSTRNGLGQAGGTGNPADAGGHYGWNAKVISHTAAEGNVVIWNARHAPPVTARFDLFNLSAYQQPLSVPAPGFLGNDTGPAGYEEVREIVITQAPAHGALVPQLNGSFIYTPDAYPIGSDRFTYEIRTAYGAVSAATVVIGIPGDLNRNGVVNFQDVHLALRIAGGLQATSPLTVDIGNADFAGDGRIGMDDALRTVKLAAGG